MADSNESKAKRGGSHFAAPQTDAPADESSTRDGADTTTASSHAAASPSKKRGVVPLVILLVVLVAVAAGGGWFFINQSLIAQRNQEQAQNTPEPATELDDSEELPDNPIDFAQVQADAPDAYAWIYVPDTNINLPILQHPSDDNYYLRRDAQGNTSIFGSIYTQSMNAKDFSDPVTLIYGHTTADGTMFDDLHKFEDASFFNDHPDMYIYTPGHVLHYRIIAAYEYDDRHILNSFNFADEAERLRYFDSVLNPTSMVVNERAGETLDASSRIVQLSTCLDAVSSQPYRYIVTGVLVDDQFTK